MSAYCTPVVYVLPKLKRRVDLGGNVIIRSNCHLYTGGWTPERGSPEEWLRRNYPGKPSKRLKLRQHWNGAMNCNFVQHGKHNAFDKERILDGAAFDQVPESCRCMNCNWMFLQS